MRIERSVTSVSWIPSEAMTGPMRVPMDLGIGHYDDTPPDRVGMLCGAVDGEEVAELGPGAIVGERVVLEGGTATAITALPAAEIVAAKLDRSALEKVAAGHKREKTERTS